MENKSNEQTLSHEQLNQLFEVMRDMLKTQIPGSEVGGRINEHPIYGHVYAFELHHEDATYSCGFFLNELIQKLQTNPNPPQWLASFFYDKIENNATNPFPPAPSSEEEVKKLVDESIVPFCAHAIREEFEEQVHVDLELHPEHGPMLEAGFPSIKDGNNTCAMPLSFLFALYLMNRDPSEPMVYALNVIKDNLQQTQE